MRSNHYAEQKVNLVFSSKQVKEAIRKVLKEKESRYPHKESGLNDVMGTYQFFRLQVNSLQFNISLSEVSENKTEVSFRVVPDSTSKANSSICSQGITDFQSELTAALTGQPLPKGSGCAVLILFALGSGFLYLLTV